MNRNIRIKTIEIVALVSIALGWLAFFFLIPDPFDLLLFFVKTWKKEKRLLVFDFRDIFGCFNYFIS